MNAPTTQLEKLRALEADIATAVTRQQQVRRDKESAVREVNAAREALVQRLAQDLDGSAATEQKALAAAERKAGEPWDARVEAAGRIIEEAWRKRGAYLTANVARVVERAIRAGGQLAGAREEGARHALLGRPRVRRDRGSGREACSGRWQAGCARARQSA